MAMKLIYSVFRFRFLFTSDLLDFKILSAGLIESDLFTSSPGIRVLVDAREKLHIPWGDPDNQRHGDTVMAFDTRSAQMVNGQLEMSVFLDYLPAIKALWVDSGIQNAYDRRREFQLVGGWQIMVAQFLCPLVFMWLLYRTVYHEIL